MQLTPNRPIFQKTHAHSTLFCVVLNLVHNIFRMNFLCKSFWVLTIKIDSLELEGKDIYEAEMGSDHWNCRISSLFVFFRRFFSNNHFHG